MTSLSVLEHLDTDLPDRAYVPYDEQLRRLGEVLEEVIRVTRRAVTSTSPRNAATSIARHRRWKPAYYYTEGPPLSGAWPVQRRAASVLRVRGGARLHARRRRGVRAFTHRPSGSLDLARSVLRWLLDAGAKTLTKAPDDVRLRDFWNKRYAEFTLSESGWFGAGEGLNERIYACKRQALRAALHALGLTPGRPWSVLDAGCGQGHFARFYRDQYPLSTYVGLDISERAVAHLRSAIPGAEFRVSDLCALRDPGSDNRTFDIVQSLEVLHLILDDDAMMRALTNLACSVTPGGALLVTAALPDQTVQRSDYLRYRSRTFWERAIALAGLRLVRDRPMYYWLPSGGPANKYLRYALTRLGPGAMYAVDRAAFGMGLPQPASAGIDSRMRLLTLQRA